MPTRYYEIILVTLDDEQQRQFKIFPSALDKIKRDLKQAAASKKILDRREHLLARGALLAAAMETAHEQGVYKVKVEHVSKGWRDKLQKGPFGACDPPRACVRTSVIERVDEIKQRSRLFREMMSEGE